MFGLLVNVSIYCGESEVFQSSLNTADSNSRPTSVAALSAVQDSRAERENKVYFRQSKIQLQIVVHNTYMINTKVKTAKENQTETVRITIIAETLLVKTRLNTFKIKIPYALKLFNNTSTNTQAETKMIFF